MANQSSYQKRRAEVLYLRRYVKRFEAKLNTIMFERDTALSSCQRFDNEVYVLKSSMKTALQCLEHGKIEEAKNILIGGLSKNESKNV